MNRNNLILVGVLLGVIAMIVFFPDVSFAGYGDFESKVQGLTSKLITVILPLVSVLGLVFAVILALTGDGAAKSRIIMVIVCSVVGFLAPHIIGWFKSASGQ